MRLSSRPVLSAIVLTFALVASGCGLFLRLGVGLVYDRVDLPEEQVIRDVPYAADGLAKHRLNLFLPTPDSVRAAGGWPTVVFVHGGGWTEGDNDLEVGGADVYNNIGRFFASRGIGAATVSYRLLPDVRWPAQIDDVAAAVAWLHAHVGDYGGDPDGLVLMGHSAGAQLAARVAFDGEPLTAQGLSTDVVCGLIAVSGAGYDLEDEETYALSNDPAYYARRFDPDGTDPDWQTAASPLRFVDADAPPTLVLYAGGETEALQRQSQLLAAALAESAVAHEVVVVPGQSHERIVPTLSRDDRTAGPAMLDFVRSGTCR
ncbi:MAG: alpha/beta hydrolase [Rhodothermales bacterium]